VYYEKINGKKNNAMGAMGAGVWF